MVKILVLKVRVRTFTLPTDSGNSLSIRLWRTLQSLAASMGTLRFLFSRGVERRSEMWVKSEGMILDENGGLTKIGTCFCVCFVLK